MSDLHTHVMVLHGVAPLDLLAQVAVSLGDSIFPKTIYNSVFHIHNS